jgi:hypothetical protein
LAVLQCCDQRSLLSAARTCPRLHQAAVLALRSISASIEQQHEANSVLLYLDRHGQHIDSLELHGVDDSAVSLRQLPANLQLSTLTLQEVAVQLQPGHGFQGVLGAAGAAGAAALKQLQLTTCKLLDEEGMEGAAAPQLPAGLEHLSISDTHSDGKLTQFLTGMVQPMQQLTCLELAFVQLKQGALANMTQLRHLELAFCTLKGAEGVEQLLHQLQHLPHLTHLDLVNSLICAEDNPLAAAYSALTASSKLQHLNISGAMVPADALLHIFPAGRRLPCLQLLALKGIQQPSGHQATAPEGSCLVSCCPSLQSMDMQDLCCSAKLLAPLLGLTGLHTLRTQAEDRAAVEAVCRL